MAVVFNDLKESALIVLYDYMLTSNHETFWFDIAAIQEGLDPDASGAFVYRALRSLVNESLIELGSDEHGDVYALTDRGIQAAEQLLEGRGHRVRAYTPAPHSDVIISRLETPESYGKIAQGLTDISRQIAESNSAGEVLGEDRELIIGELVSAEGLSKNERFRLGRMLAFILPTLRYIADKFAGQGLGEAAKQFIHYLLSIS